MKIFFLTLLLLTLTGAIQLHAQSLIIKQHGAEEDSLLLSTIQKISFSNGTLLFHFVDGIENPVQLSEIQKIYFKADSLNPISKPEIFDKMEIIPNPALDYANLVNIPQLGSSIYIYRMDGILVMRTNATSNKKTLDLSHLPSGVYILKTNSQTLKFIKL